MKKLLITTLAVSSVLAFASAQEGYNYQDKKLVRPLQAKMMASSSAPTKPTSVGEVMRRDDMQKPVAPKTGDAVIDAQIASLFQEQEAKIKAIRDEYQAKIKAIMGDKKAMNKEGRDGMMGTGTRPAMNDDMKKKMEGEYRNSSGTRPMPKMEGDRPMMDNGSGTPRAMPPKREGDRPKPVSAFEGFFKSFFGGNAREAQAGEVQQ